MSAWIHWILTGLVPLCMSVAMWFALIEIRGLRERAAASERAVKQIADAIRYAAKRAQEKENHHD